jgi:hypothetical protein
LDLPILNDQKKKLFLADLDYRVLFSMKCEKLVKKNFVMRNDAALLATLESFNQLKGKKGRTNTNTIRDRRRRERVRKIKRKRVRG